LSFGPDQPWQVVDSEGLGMAPFETVWTEGPGQEGATLAGRRLQPRRVRLWLRGRAASPTARWQARASLIAVVKPQAQPLTLELRLPDGQRRSLDVHLLRGPELVGRERDGLSERVCLELLAPDSTFYDPQTLTLRVGQAQIGQVQPLIYPGTWRGLPSLRIVGPLQQPRFTNLSTGAILGLSRNLAAGEWVRFDLGWGDKRVLGYGGANWLPYVSSESDLEGFAVAAHPDIEGGVNLFRLEGTGASAATEALLATFVRYLGV
jgi:hypothetical protein